MASSSIARHANEKARRPVVARKQVYSASLFLYEAIAKRIIGGAPCRNVWRRKKYGDIKAIFYAGINQLREPEIAF